jgi:hypothetical protein
VSVTWVAAGVEIATASAPRAGQLLQREGRAGEIGGDLAAALG